MNPPYFRECFGSNVTGTRNFALYKSVLSASASSPSAAAPEKHHIVPREWLTWNVQGFDFEHEDASNVVYLSVRNKILAMQYLALMFLDAGDSETYRRITKTIARRYGLVWHEFWRNPYLDAKLVGRLVEKRAAELSSRKQKYDDSFLSRCKKIMDCGNWSDTAFDKVKSELGFKYSMRALKEQIERRFGKT